MTKRTKLRIMAEERRQRKDFGLVDVSSLLQNHVIRQSILDVAGFVKQKGDEEHMKNNNKPSAARGHLLRLGLLNPRTNKPDPAKIARTGVGISNNPTTSSRKK